MGAGHADYLVSRCTVFAMAMPMLVLYANSALGPFLTRDLHLEPELLGYLVMSSFGLASVLSLWAGAFVDRVGSRYSLIVLFSAVALAFTLIAMAENFYGLVAATAICGIAQALANPVTNLLITQQVSPEKKAKVVGLKQAGVQFAALFAGLVLPGIASQYGWQFAFGLIVPVAMLFGITAPSLPPGKPRRRNQKLRAFAAESSAAVVNSYSVLRRDFSLGFCHLFANFCRPARHAAFAGWFPDCGLWRHGDDLADCIDTYRRKTQRRVRTIALVDRYSGLWDSSYDARRPGKSLAAVDRRCGHGVDRGRYERHSDEHAGKRSGIWSGSNRIRICFGRFLRRFCSGAAALSVFCRIIPEICFLGGLR